MSGIILLQKTVGVTICQTRFEAIQEISKNTCYILDYTDLVEPLSLDKRI
jgi:hypothetical protein